MKIDFVELVIQLAAILRGDMYHRSSSGWSAEQQRAPAREWHRREQNKYRMHPAVIKALGSDHRPYNWHLLVLEWPHVSETDSTRLAYTRDERSGIADRQVITTVGKYITRHFPTMPDHEVRNLVALYAAGESCKFVHTMAEMLYHLHRGPTSCMGGDKNFDVRCDDGERRHPYQVYDPKYGWHMAVRVENDDTVGRALCIDNGVHEKYFVRTYAKTGGYSHADERLHAWLLEQGYKHRSCYMDGTKLAYYPTSDDFLAPYIDGGEQRVEIYNNELRIDSNGDYECGKTDGAPSGGDRIICDDCGDRFDDGDGYWVGAYEDVHVCSTCCDDNYTYAYTRRGHQHYIRNDDTVAVNGDYYDTDYLADNNIVELANGEYEDLENCAEIHGEWYRTDDDDVCYAEDIEEYALQEDCWMCYESGNWYTNETAALMDKDGRRYHEDHAPEQTTEEE